MSKCGSSENTKKKCHKVCRGPRGLRGRMGPTGPQGEPGPQGPTQRVLKVQLISGVPTPIFIEGFSWENDVAEPPSWPVAGSFSFYKATMLNIEPYGVGELFNVNGAVTHTDTAVQHQVVIAHYRGTTLLDYHTASSQVAGVEDTLLAQSLQDAEVGDCFYFAISPDVGDLTHFNYNLGSLKQHPCFTIGKGFSELLITSPGINYVKVAVDEISLFVLFVGAGGGGGAGQATTNDGITTSIGRGGGGGGAGGFFTNFFRPEPNPPIPVVAKNDDVFKLFLGHGGAGGSAKTGANADGSTGQTSFMLLNGSTGFGVTGFQGMNPIPGGGGGGGGTGGGMGGSGTFCGGPGGGGGAGLINGVPNTPGGGGLPGPPCPGLATFEGFTGGTNPRSGGSTTETIGGETMTNVGGAGGFNTGPSSGQGSGGGAGGMGFSQGGRISGGDGGLGTGEPGKKGAGGGGGGSGGLGSPGSFILGGNGGQGVGSFVIIRPSS